MMAIRATHVLMAREGILEVYWTGDRWSSVRAGAIEFTSYRLADAARRRLTYDRDVLILREVREERVSA
jgi:hypothetical protein